MRERLDQQSRVDRRLAWAIRSVCSASGATVDTGRRFAARRCAINKTAEVAAQRYRIVAAKASRVRLAAADGCEKRVGAAWICK
jgi:hypothetical protein